MPLTRAWWAFTNSLMMKGASQASAVPPLKRPDGAWATSSFEGAFELAAAFALTFSLPRPMTKTCANSFL